MEMDRRRLLKISLLATAANVVGLREAQAGNNDSFSQTAFVIFQQIQLVYLLIVFQNLFFGSLISGQHKFQRVGRNPKVKDAIAEGKFIGHVYLVDNIMVLLPILALEMIKIRFIWYVHNEILNIFIRPKVVKRSRHITFKPEEVKRLGSRVGRAYLSGNKVVMNC